MLFKNIFTILSTKIYYLIGYLRASIKGVKLSPYCKISPKANIDGVRYIGEASIASNVTIGKGSYINSGVIHSGYIGEYCSIGYDVCIGPTEHDYSNWTTSPALNNKNSELYVVPPNISHDVWICAGVTILRGCKIGKGSIVAAGAVVTKDIPEYEIWGGVPAKFIKKRFSDKSLEVSAREKLDNVLRLNDEDSMDS
ncbi:capsular polysaccharide biosynthesis protein Cap5H [Photobacterium angustum S14]|uniref:Capsular polysaccharide biosynthesis protein Cap5H n=1 Tax=Photobacterium angustum (strain S14 / CCUG 15956) TaxID=314292 RepID=Q1ZRK4_PHOAS|nr:CatB-related O-acetyltransferase [Photobacterium angustum]EAS65323.1 capsular polysaccharide biosynthesis protein Cap5H [Photobacterium angustum S14]